MAPTELDDDTVEPFRVNNLQHFSVNSRTPMKCVASHPVRGWYIAMGQYSSLCDGAVVYSLDAVDIGEDVLVRVQVG